MDNVACACDHLTSFAVLLVSRQIIFIHMHIKVDEFFSLQDVAPVDEPDNNKTIVEEYIEESLYWITVIGCCVSALSLTVILVTYIGER